MMSSTHPSLGSINTPALQVALRLPLHHFQLEIDLTTQARVTGFFGPSGCGKTSFLEVIAGLRHHASGMVRFGDEIWQDSSSRRFVPAERRHIGYVPQDGLLFPHLTVLQNLQAGWHRAARAQHPWQETFERVVELLELGKLLHHNVRLLSGGERQRVALGRALCSAPRLLLLDEPMASLDHKLKRRILPFLRRIRDEFAIPMVLVSHDPIEVQALCDDMVVLQQGKLVKRGEPNEVLMDPAIFPRNSERGFENILPCTTIASDAQQTTVALGVPRTRVTLALPNLTEGVQRAKFVGIFSRDVIIATTRPEDISARNILPATIVAMHALGNCELVKVRIDKLLPLVAIEVGRSACDALLLHPGQAVYLIIKSMACSLYEEYSRDQEVTTYNKPATSSPLQPTPLEFVGSSRGPSSTV